MGRDELNLVEFPLAALADRVPPDVKTLTFEDRIWDKGQEQEITRRLTISASDAYGLPTALDDEVILGLVQLSKAENFASRTVSFSRYRLVQLLNWRDEGKSYRRLEESLKRWLGVTLYYENAWWDKRRQRWMDAHFHLLDNVNLYRRPKKRSGVVLLDDENAASSFTWNEIVFQSFQAGYLKQIDMELYRGLQLATAKRMYRFLDKRFHFTNRLQFELGRFAHEHIGLGRNYDVAQLKRRLNPAISELEEAGFLEPLPIGDRFLRRRRGDWQVIFTRKAKSKKRSARLDSTPPLEKELIMRGVTPVAACRLVRNHPAMMIQEKLVTFDLFRAKNDYRVSRNPAGYLVQSIRKDYQADGLGGRPAAIPVASSGQSVLADSTPPRRIVVPNQKSAAERKREREAEAYLHGLSEAEMIRIEAEALLETPHFLVKGYWRTKEAGNSTAFNEYRKQIVKRHINEKLLG